MESFSNKGDGAGLSCSGPSIMFGACEKGKMSITASEEGLSSSDAEDSTDLFTSAATVQSESEDELVAMFPGWPRASD